MLNSFKSFKAHDLFYLSLLPLTNEHLTIKILCSSCEAILWEQFLRFSFCRIKNIHNSNPIFFLFLHFPTIQRRPYCIGTCAPNGQTEYGSKKTFTLHSNQQECNEVQSQSAIPYSRHRETVNAGSYSCTDVLAHRSIIHHTP
jgi:hypothetical protein